MEVSDTEKAQEILECLIQPVGYYMMGFKYFASPTVMKKIENETAPTKALAAELVPRFLKSASIDLRCQAAGTLAFYRIESAYPALDACSDIPYRATFYAILGDKRAIPWIVAQYREIDAKYRKHPAAAYQPKMMLLNALYHLPSPELSGFLQEVISHPGSKEILSRALKVKARLSLPEHSQPHEK